MSAAHTKFLTSRTKFWKKFDKFDKPIEIKFTDLEEKKNISRSIIIFIYNRHTNKSTVRN